MRKFLRGSAANAILLLFLLGGCPASAADVKVLCSVALEGVLNELRPRFEGATGHRLVIDYDFPSRFKHRIETGEPFDVTIMSPVDDDLIKQGKIVANTVAAFARTGVGVGMRSGEPKPDIGTTDAFKRMLIAGTTIAYGDGSATGTYFLALIERLGIAEEIKPKLKPYGVGGAVKAVASGEAQYVVNGVSLIVGVAGVELAGPFPPEFQNYVIFTGGLSAAAKAPDAGKALLSFLRTPAAGAVFRAKGFEPAIP